MYGRLKPCYLLISNQETTSPVVKYVKRKLSDGALTVLFLLLSLNQNESADMANTDVTKAEIIAHEIAAQSGDITAEAKKGALWFGVITLMFPFVALGWTIWSFRERQKEDDAKRKRITW